MPKWYSSGDYLVFETSDKRQAERIKKFFVKEMAKAKEETIPGQMEMEWESTSNSAEVKNP